jgi:hypothetical protein
MMRGPACRGDLSLNGVKEANELLMPMMLHAAADDAPFQHVQRGEQRGGAVPDVIMGHSAADRERGLIATPPVQRSYSKKAVL